MRDSDRRAQPRIWNTDWLILRGLTGVLSDQIEQRLPRGAQLVDLGCGAMPYRAMMLHAGVRYLGADIDGKGELLIDRNGQVPLDSASSDAILSIQVLEHVPDLDAYCAEIRRLLRDDGMLLLSTHGTWLYHPHPGDYRRWTRSGLADELGRRGLKVEETISVVGPLATTTLIRLTGFAFVLRQLPLAGPFLAGVLAVLMNLRAMLEDKVTPRSFRDDNACVYFVTARKARA
jgi:SAM-dependent methyltransferase